MLFFLLFFITLYGGINLYFFRKVHLALPGNGAAWGAGVFCLAMVAAPILVRLLEREGWIASARVCAWVGHTWMAGVFWFLCIGLMLDAWNLGLRGAVRWQPSASGWVVSPRALPLIAGAVALTLMAWGFHEAWNVRLKTVVYRTPRLASGSAPMRIAVISDLHLSLTIGEGFAGRVTELIERSRPDLVVCLGDMADAEFERVNGAAQRLAAVAAPMGKYAVLGNHEFYAGLRNGLALLKAAGFTVLRGESAVLRNGAVVAGVDDPVARTQGEAFLDEGRALPPAGSERPLTILLKHRPDVAPASLGRFDLQLSGHSHGGQIFPFNLVVKLFHPLGPGRVDLAGGAMLYVSRGTGTWGPRLRFTQPPEVTLVIVEPKE